MNFIQEHEARLEKARRQMSEDLKSASAGATPDQSAAPLVGTGSWLSVGAKLRNKHSGNAAEIYDHPRPGMWTIRLIASSHVFERTTAEVMQNWTPTDNVAGEP